MRREHDSGDDLRVALSRVAEIAGDGTGCPEQDRLVSSARGELPRREDGEVILHIAECTACAAAWRVAREILVERTVPAHALPSREAPSVGWMRWAAAAAVLVAAIGVGILYLGPERETAPVYREQGEDVLASLLDEAEPLPRSAFLLRWVAAPDGSLYDVVVTDERLRTLARSTGLTTSEYGVPEDALDAARSGDRLFWQVTAYLPDGREIESPTFIARVE